LERSFNVLAVTQQGPDNFKSSGSSRTAVKFCVVA
jgi:hypothetical protein